MQSLRPWEQLTTGTPAALRQSASALNIAKQLATLQGFQCATLGPSTFHLFWDLFGILVKKHITIYVDTGVYPISKWGVERASAASVSVKTFRHHDPDKLKRLIYRANPPGKQPIIVTDGFCPVCGKAAPLTDYLSIIRHFDGYLVIDDTQALGILGHHPAQHKPYGLGGGGSLRWHNIQDSHIISVCSLAKGFGVPLAILSGSDEFVRRFEAESDTRVHSSPASIADIHATEHALKINRLRGDALRKRLARNIARFRRNLHDAGIQSQGGFFPVQSIPIPVQTAQLFYQRLQDLGVSTVLQQSCISQKPGISFVITARHKISDLDNAIRVLINIRREFESTAYQRKKIHCRC
jgi:8-amino-7-oxononanoate synthase